MRFIKIGALLIPSLLVCVGVTAYSFHWFRESSHRNYNSRPPALAFQEAFHQPVPADIRELVAAGKSSLGYSTVWLRFRASPETIRALTVDAIPAPRWQRGAGMANEPSLLLRYEVLDRLDWSKAWTLGEADYWIGGSVEHSTQLAIDRKTGTVYAYYYST